MSDSTTLEREKILFRQIVAPNITRWLKDRVCEDSYLTSEGVRHFKYIPLELKDSANKSRYIALVVEGKAKTWVDRSEIRKQVKPKMVPDVERYSLNVESLGSFASSHDKWCRGDMLFVLALVQDIEEFKSLQSNFNFDKALQKAAEQKTRQKKYLQKRRVVKFTLSVQKKIANILMRRLITKTDNYLLKLLYDAVDTEQADTSGRSLIEATAILGLTRQEIADLLINSSSSHARRMVALFADDSAVSLLDKDSDVRMAAQMRRAQK